MSDQGPKGQAFSEKTDEGQGPKGQAVAVVLPHHMTTGAGRRSMIHDEHIVNEVVDNIKAGCTQAVAAQAAGISERTYHYWKRRAEVERTRLAQGLPEDPGETPYLQFLQKLERAEAMAEAGMVAEIRAEPGGAKWIMPRRWPSRWSATSRSDVRILHARSSLDSLPADIRSAVEELLMRRIGTGEEDQVIEG